jgi:hypothetical protein
MMMGVFSINNDTDTVDGVLISNKWPYEVLTNNDKPTLLVISW